MPVSAEMIRLIRWLCGSRPRWAAPSLDGLTRVVVHESDECHAQDEGEQAAGDLEEADHPEAEVSAARGKAHECPLSIGNHQ